MSEVFEAVLRKHTKPKAGVGDQGDVPYSDAPHVEETKAYIEKMSRWSRRALAAVGDYRWWICVQIANRSREPQKHLLNYLQKPALGDVHSPTPLSKLVSGHVHKIAKHSEELLKPAAWQDIVAGGPKGQQV